MPQRSAESPSRLPFASRLAPVTLAALLAALPALAQNRTAPAQPVAPALQPLAERCAACHASLTARRSVHPSLVKNECNACHAPDPGQGKCRSKTSSHWKLARQEPDLCYSCHKRLDQSKSVHTVVRQGSCLSCHDPHGSDNPKQLTSARDQICFDCHEAEPLMSKPVRHAPVAEGRCLSCHDPHGGDQPNHVKGAGTAFCLNCHDAKAPTGLGTPGPAYRVDLAKPVVHKPIPQKNDCGVCHEVGHSGDNLKLLKKPVLELCSSCHERQDKARFPHTAVIAGDCAVCHDPHSSDQPKLRATDTTAATCFRCHHDDLTGRKVIHKPIEKGCDQCHQPHGGGNRNLLKGGEGKKHCYTCHQTPVDTGKNKHAALERYGCTGCHDPHGTANRFLLGRRTNDLCITCHEAQKDGRHVTPMVASGHVVGGDRNDPRKPDRPFTCASCHNPHGSDSPKLLYYGQNPMESCDVCHGDKTGKHPEFKNIISRSRRPVPSGAAGGAGAGAGGAGSGGAGSGGAGSGGSGSGGSGSGSGGDLPGNVR